MINEKIFLCRPINFFNKIKVYPPTVNQVIDNENYARYRRLFTISQEELEDEYVKAEKGNLTVKVPTPFQYLISNYIEHPEFESIVKEAFEFFTKEQFTFIKSANKFVVGDFNTVIAKAKSLKDLIIFGEEDYFAFQNVVRQAIGEPLVEPPNPDEDPRVKRIKAKARYRDHIKAKAGIGVTLGTSLASICCMGIGLTPLNIGEISYASLRSIIRTYQEKEKYNTDLKAIIAGADAKKIQLKYWIRNLED